jgi:GDP/UDP-N,N'-diacetylbacillosamine 2-epimerase (hydrolysing)
LRYGYDSLEDLKPDLLVVLGDRYEILSVAIVATILRIPIAHIHGGENTEGAFDEPFRHSITKMSHLHFTSTDEYRKRVIQLGEEPSNVFNVGALAVDNIKKQQLLSKEEFENSIEFKLNKQNLLITFHPVTLENRTAGEQFDHLLTVLDKLKNTHLIFTKTNSDTHGSIINQMIDNYVDKHSDKAKAYNSLGRLRYLSAMQHVNGLIGNSSSGLIEAPYFNIGIADKYLKRPNELYAFALSECLST